MTRLSTINSQWRCLREKRQSRLLLNWGNTSPSTTRRYSIFFLSVSSLRFRRWDPYLIMKAIVSVLDGLQVFPIYYIVKHVSKSRTGATVAAVVAVVTPSDFKMISWGGYANIAGLLLLAILAYYVIKGKTVAVVLVAAMLFLTHHLSMLFAVALFLPYFLITWWRTKTLPKCLIAFCAALGVAYIVFYWQALIPLYDLYTRMLRATQNSQCPLTGHKCSACLS